MHAAFLLTFIKGDGKFQEMYTLFYLILAALGLYDEFRSLDLGASLACMWLKIWALGLLDLQL